MPPKISLEGLGERVMIIGSPGSGKTSLARSLASRLSLPHQNLDDHYWGPGWVPLEPASWERRLRTLVEGDRWLIDGNYRPSLDLRLRRAQSVIFLDLPTHVCLYRVCRRMTLNLLGIRQDFPAQVREANRVRRQNPFHEAGLLVRQVLMFRSKERPEILAKLAHLEPGQRVIRLHDPAEVQALIENFQS